ncbi:MAG: hypothetical protein RL491_538 [Bacteroidota bacterium]
MEEMTYLLFGTVIGMSYSNIVHLYLICENERNEND